MAWQDQYENAAQQERNLYDALSVAMLLDSVNKGQHGAYNSLWRSLAERATLQQAGWPLFAVLQRDQLDFLIRCNCAEALLRLLGRDNELALLEEAVNLASGTAATRLPHLVALKSELLERLK